MSAGSVMAGTAPFQEASGGSIPTPALHSLKVLPIPMSAARQLIERNHYQHSLPGGTHLSLGVFVHRRLSGALTFGAGPFNSPSLVRGATAEDCLCLTRLWLSDELPKNSESRVLGVVIHALRRNTRVKFLLTYADPAQAHVGVIYQATGWVYTGLSDAMPLYNLGDGRLRHSRSLSHAYGTHSVRHFADHGVELKVVQQSRKHRYIYFLDPTWRSRLQVSIHPYPKQLHTVKEEIP